MNDLSSAPAELDVVGIGNALVDVISHETDEFVDRLGVPKGAMTLIDQERATELYDAMGAAIEISAIKVVAPNTALRVVDRAIQAHGGGGVSDDFPLAAMYAGIRTLRIADGPDEVHRMVIARREIRRVTESGGADWATSGDLGVAR